MCSLEAFSELTNEVAEDLVAQLRPAANDGSLVDVQGPITNSALRNIGHTAFGWVSGAELLCSCCTLDSAAAARRAAVWLWPQRC